MKAGKYFGAHKRNSGFAIGMILLVIVLIGAIVGAIAVASRSSNTNASGETAKIQASALLQQGINLRSGYDLMLARGADAGAISWDTSSPNGLFHPTDGGAVKQTPPSEAIVASADAVWKYKKVVSLMGVGIDGNDDYVGVVANVKLKHCQYINHILYGMDTSATPPTAAAGSLADWQTEVTAINLSADASVTGKPEGCIQTTTAGSYVYYKALYER